jgi:hypothetical protein
MDGRGFTAETWSALGTFQGRCATAHDVDQGAAVFALGDTFNGKPIDMRLPQPVIWWSDDEDEVGAVAVQAECHETQDEETLEVLGLVLPDGRTAISLLEDCDEVDPTDPVWIALVEEAVEVGADEVEDDGDTAWDDDEIYP